MRDARPPRPPAPVLPLVLPSSVPPSLPAVLPPPSHLLRRGPRPSHPSPLTPPLPGPAPRGGAHLARWILPCKGNGSAVGGVPRGPAPVNGPPPLARRCQLKLRPPRPELLGEDLAPHRQARAGEGYPVPLLRKARKTPPPWSRGWGAAGAGRCQVGRLRSNGGQRVTCAAALGPEAPASPWEASGAAERRTLRRLGARRLPLRALRPPQRRW